MKGINDIQVIALNVGKGGFPMKFSKEYDIDEDGDIEFIHGRGFANYLHHTSFKKELELLGHKVTVTMDDGKAVALIVEFE